MVLPLVAGVFPIIGPMYGKTYMGAERTTFIIGSDGKVAQVLRKVKPAEHDALVLTALAEASPPVA
jgi:peroxiredoxin